MLYSAFGHGDQEWQFVRRQKRPSPLFAKKRGFSILGRLTNYLIWPHCSNYYPKMPTRIQLNALRFPKMDTTSEGIMGVGLTNVWNRSKFIFIQTRIFENCACPQTFGYVNTAETWILQQLNKLRHNRLHANGVDAIVYKCTLKNSKLTVIEPSDFESKSWENFFFICKIVRPDRPPASSLARCIGNRVHGGATFRDLEKLSRTYGRFWSSSKQNPRRFNRWIVKIQQQKIKTVFRTTGAFTEGQRKDATSAPPRMHLFPEGAYASMLQGIYHSAFGFWFNLYGPTWPLENGIFCSDANPCLGPCEMIPRFMARRRYSEAAMIDWLQWEFSTLAPAGTTTPVQIPISAN